MSGECTRIAPNPPRLRPERAHFRFSNFRHDAELKSVWQRRLSVKQNVIRIFALVCRTEVPKNRSGRLVRERLAVAGTAIGISPPLAAGVRGHLQSMFTGHKWRSVVTIL